MTLAEPRVLDASVVVKCFLIEEGSDAARAVVGATSDWIAPDLLLLEVASVAMKSWRRGLIDRGQAEAMVARTPRLLSGLTAVSEVADAALAIAIDSGASVYDAAYLALARTRNCPLLTADRRLRDLARSAGLDLSIILLDEV